MTEPRDDGDDGDLERVMRDGLQHRAERADTSAPVADRARAAAGRRRHGRVAVGVAGLAVAAVAVTGVVLQQTGPGKTQPPTLLTDNPSPTSTTDAVEGGWRTESWHGVQVDVPADWGWGGAPQTGFGSGPDLWCGGPGSILDSTGRRLDHQDPAMAYVGRAILQSDMCVRGIEDETPQAPYVWLGAPIDLGTVDLGGGYVRETREVNGSTISVATRDAALRERILDSATGGETCISELDSAPVPRQSPRAGGAAGLQPESMTVCAYRDENGSGTLGLVYAAVLDRAHAHALVRAAAATDRIVPGCVRSEQPGWEYVVLRVDGTSSSGEPASREYVVDFACAVLQGPGASFVALGRETVDPWAVDGIKVSLTGTYGANGELSGYFIGMQG